MMRGHASTIDAEISGGRRLERQREIDLLDCFAELTIYTSSACLIGKKFREQLDDRFAQLYHDLERGTDALAYVDAYAASRFRRRDEARVELVEARRGHHRPASGRARSPER